jgi:hypothetical protein
MGLFSGLFKAFPGSKPTVSKKGLTHSFLSGGILPPVQSESTSQALGLTQPEIPEVPGTPTIDDARVQRQETDRIRRRKGILANVVGGSSASSTPNVGTKTLLGS